MNAVATINDVEVDMSENGEFSLQIRQEGGRNSIEIIARDPDGHQISEVRLTTRIPLYQQKTWWGF
jgi:hypothetical protein